ncbi:hypothetical protein [Chitinophaga pinensis]|uniref:Uncharacterized protein n=1 Tax=Chitinophaga pinensis TaxID=79329 RepID=A0A5C6M2N5_9BACT|nr:hypothetical protein [Chitinophaga pinensis]TWW01986.1 hypothetical protein FEF09_02270 [Chitinophaga pinensis]
MKHLYFLAAACMIMTVPAFAQNAWKIQPGEYIGNTKLGEKVEEMSKELGNADGGDAAMGKAWSFWYSRKKDDSIDSSRFLAVYSVREEADGKEAMVVKQVRVNTASFKTSRGLKVGSAYIEIKKLFPAIKVVAQYEDRVRGKKITVYDVRNSGIAFEMTAEKGRKEICSAITVHPKGENVNAYILFPGYEGLRQLQN